MSWRARPAGASREADRSAKPPHIAGLGPRRARRAYEKEGSIRMDFQFLTLERRDGVATITLNRPDAFNALSLGLGRELFHAALDVDEDPAVRCIVVTGAGRAFCAGGDVKDFVDNLERIGVLVKELTTYLHGTVSRFCRSDKPVIMAVNGVAAGGGLSFALSGDLVVAAESARFTMAYSKIAATPDGSSSYFLPRLVGLRRAMELYFTNRVLSAREAFEWGLVTAVVPAAELRQDEGDPRVLGGRVRPGRRASPPGRLRGAGAPGHHAGPGVDRGRSRRARMEPAGVRGAPGHSVLGDDEAGADRPRPAARHRARHDSAADPQRSGSSSRLASARTQPNVPNPGLSRVPALARVRGRHGSGRVPGVVAARPGARRPERRRRDRALRRARARPHQWMVRRGIAR